MTCWKIGPGVFSAGLAQSGEREIEDLKALVRSQELAHHFFSEPHNYNCTLALCVSHGPLRLLNLLDFS